MSAPTFSTVMGFARLVVTLLAGAALALGVLGAASARTHAAAKYGGTLVVGLRQDPGSLDPTVNLAGAGTIFRAICLQLYDFGAKQQLVPFLAAALPVISKDKLSYTVQLRKGIEFNDGTPFNAQAVVTTVQRFISYPGSTKASNYADVDSITAAGPYTVVYHLKARDSTFTAGTSSYVLSPTALASEGDNFAAHPVCVGPFMFDNQAAGDHVTVIKSPYYYDQKDVYLDKIVFKPITDLTAAATALKAGDIQALDSFSTTELPGVQQSSTLRVLQADNLGWSGVVINIGNKNGVGNLPYANNVGTPLSSSAKLRQAFEEAIDRNTLNKVVYGGLEHVSCTAVPAADTAWYDAINVPCTPYDPREAKKLVAASGFQNPTVHLLVTSTTDNLRKAQFIQAQEAAVGINVVIDATGASDNAARVISGNFDAAIRTLPAGNPDPHRNIYPYLATAGATNYSGYSNPRLDFVLNNGLKATDPKARAVNYHVAQQIIHDDRPIIYLYSGITFGAFNTSLTGVQLSSNGTMNVANARYG